MSATFPPSPIVVVDANVAIGAILPVLSAGVDMLEQFAGWRREGVRLVAPMLWLAVCVSVIRRSVHEQAISPGEGRVAIEDLFALEVETMPLDEKMCRSAFAWAERLGQAKAYDGLYLALAERLGAEMWTTDERLVREAQQAGVAWVQWIGEEW